MQGRVVWFVLGVLIGSLFVVSAYPQSSSWSSTTTGTSLPTISVSQAVSKLRSGDFVIVDSKTLEALVKMKVLPYAPIFNGNTLYAVKVLPDKKFFVYASPNVRNIDKFLNRAKNEFSKIDWSRDITLKVNPSNFSWQVIINGKPSDVYRPLKTTSVSAHIESTIEWDSQDNWKPHGRLKLVWEVYRLADTDPKNDYRVVDMKTFVWSGHYLYGDSGWGKWQTDTVRISVNVKPDGNSVFDLADFGPSHMIDRYNFQNKSVISYTLGTGGASITIDQIVKLFSIAVDYYGNQVEWTYTFNRDESESYANSWVKLEPGYQFITHIPSSPTTAHQKLVASVKWTYNRPWWFDDHFTGSITIDWVWHLS